MNRLNRSNIRLTGLSGLVMILALVAAACSAGARADEGGTPPSTDAPVTTVKPVDKEDLASFCGSLQTDAAYFADLPGAHAVSADNSVTGKSLSFSDDLSEVRSGVITGLMEDVNADAPRALAYWGMIQPGKIFGTPGPVTLEASQALIGKLADKQYAGETCERLSKRLETLFTEGKGNDDKPYVRLEKLVPSDKLSALNILLFSSDFTSVGWLCNVPIPEAGVDLLISPSLYEESAGRIGPELAIAYKWRAVISTGECPGQSFTGTLELPKEEPAPQPEGTTAQPNDTSGDTGGTTAQPNDTSGGGGTTGTEPGSGPGGAGGEPGGGPAPCTGSPGCPGPGPGGGGGEPNPCSSGECPGTGTTPTTAPSCTTCGTTTTQPTTTTPTPTTAPPSTAPPTTKPPTTTTPPTTAPPTTQPPTTTTPPTTAPPTTQPPTTTTVVKGDPPGCFPDPYPNDLPGACQHS